MSVNIHNNFQVTQLLQLFSEKTLRNKADRIVAYIMLISQVDEAGNISITTSALNSLWSAWGFTYRTTGIFFQELVADKLLIVINKEGKKGHWHLTIPKKYLVEIPKKSGRNNFSYDCDGASLAEEGGKNLVEIPKKSGRNKKSEKTSASEDEQSLQVNVEKIKKLPSPQSLDLPSEVNGSQKLISTGLSPDNPLTQGGSKRGGNLTVGEINTPKVIIEMGEKEEQNKKIKNKKNSTEVFSFTHPDGEIVGLKFHPKNYSFIGKKINILYADYQNVLTKRFPRLDEGDQMMQIIRRYDKHLATSGERPKGWWFALLGILDAENKKLIQEQFGLGA